MFACWIPSTLRDLCRARTTRTAKRARFYRPQLEVLEDRVQPSKVIWDGGGASTNWTDRFNWAKDIAPIAGDDLFFPSGAAKLTNVNNFPSGTVFNSLTFSGSRYTVDGSHSLNLGAGGIFYSASSGMSCYNGLIQWDRILPIQVVKGGSLALGGARRRRHQQDRLGYADPQYTVFADLTCQ